MAAETHVKDAGTWRKASEIHVKDSGTWRNLNEAHVKDAGTWRKVFEKSYTLTTFQYNATSQKSRIYAFEVDGVLLTTYTGNLTSACGFNSGEGATNAFDASYLTGAASNTDACVMTWTKTLTFNTQFRALVQMYPNQTNGSITFNGTPMTYDSPGTGSPSNNPSNYYSWWFKYP